MREKKLSKQEVVPCETIVVDLEMHCQIVKERLAAQLWGVWSADILPTRAALSEVVPFMRRTAYNQRFLGGLRRPGDWLNMRPSEGLYLLQSSLPVWQRLLSGSQVTFLLYPSLLPLSFLHRYCFLINILYPKLHFCIFWRTQPVLKNMNEISLLCKNIITKGFILKELLQVLFQEELK